MPVAALLRSHDNKKCFQRLSNVRREKEDKYYIWLKTSAINRKLVYFLKHTFRYLIINISSKIILLPTWGTSKLQSTEEGGPVWGGFP